MMYKYGAFCNISVIGEAREVSDGKENLQAF
jgi:hypothetical protein